MNNPALIICGPTATGKTALALELARQYNGEIVSADSRQVYAGMTIVTGKDLPDASPAVRSPLKWRDRFLPYYLVRGIKIWLYDIVSPPETFNVAFWHECAHLVITDILSRRKLPIVVGGTGLYLKSLTHSLANITIPPNPQLRQQLSHLSVLEQFDYLQRVNPAVASALNLSDRRNPRRLTRALEISLSGQTPSAATPLNLDCFLLGLTAPLPVLYAQIDQSVLSRLRAGAGGEARRLAARYSPDLPSFTACGYPALLSSRPFPAWTSAEHAYARRQLTWFKKQPGVNWIDTTTSLWRNKAQKMVSQWYNS